VGTVLVLLWDKVWTVSTPVSSRPVAIAASAAAVSRGSAAVSVAFGGVAVKVSVTVVAAIAIAVVVVDAVGRASTMGGPVFVMTRTARDRSV